MAVRPLESKKKTKQEDAGEDTTLLWPERSRKTILSLSISTTRRIQERCHIEMISNLQRDQLLLPGTRKEGKTPTFRSRKEKDKYRSMKSCDQKLIDNVGIIGKFMDLHLRDPFGKGEKPAKE